MAILVFIALLAVLILVHELGHFLMAKKEGVKVEEFAFGFPPRLWSKKIKGTVYSLNLIPLGGYVRLYGEDEPRGKGSFISKSVWSRFKIVSAGVIMNLLLGYLFLLIYLGLGNGPLASNPSDYSSWVNSYRIYPIILQIDSDSAAEKMGLKVGDIILQVNGREFERAESFSRFTAQNPNQEIEMSVQRDKEILTLKGRIDSNESRGEIGVTVADYFDKVRFKWWAVPLMAGIDLFNLIATILYFFGNLVLSLFGRAQPIGTVVGPVGIYILTKKAVELGFSYVLRLATFLTVNLALVNFLPLPALDGGRAILLGLEKIKGKRLKPEVESWVHLVGFIVILVLMVALTIRDIVKLF